MLSAKESYELQFTRCAATGDKVQWRKSIERKTLGNILYCTQTNGLNAHRPERDWRDSEDVVLRNLRCPGRPHRTRYLCAKQDGKKGALVTRWSCAGACPSRADAPTRSH